MHALSLLLRHCPEVFGRSKQVSFVRRFLLIRTHQSAVVVLAKQQHACRVRDDDRVHPHGSNSYYEITTFHSWILVSSCIKIRVSKNGMFVEFFGIATRSKASKARNTSTDVVQSLFVVLVFVMHFR